MAIQFANFLNAPIVKPDYSGIGDAVNNYYAGRQMPNDDLIKAIQAKFAEPDARMNLRNAGLTGDYTALQIKQLAQQLAQQQGFINLMQKLRARGQVPQPNMTAPQQPAGMPPAHVMANALVTPQNASVPTMPPVITTPTAYTGTPADNGGVIPPAKGGFDPNADISSGSVINPADMQGIDPTKMDRRFIKFDQMGSGLPRSAYNAGANPSQVDPNTIAPALANAFAGAKSQGSILAPPAKPVMINGVAPPQTSGAMNPLPTSPTETVISPGDPSLYQFDQAFDAYPEYRKNFEAQGYKKTIQTKFDNKTGTTRMITTYPSGRVTMTTISPTSTGSDGTPLTNAMVTQHQKVISGVDNTLPIINELIKQGEIANGDRKNDKGEDQTEFEPFPRQSEPGVFGSIGGGSIPGWKSKSVAYEAKVNSALDTLMAAYGMPKTEGGLDSVRSQLLIGHGETDRAYVKRLKDLVADLNRRRAYSANEVKRAQKYGIDTGAGGNEASNMSDEELQGIANGSD